MKTLETFQHSTAAIWTGLSGDEFNRLKIKERSPSFEELDYKNSTSSRIYYIEEENLIIRVSSCWGYLDKSNRLWVLSSEAYEVGPLLYAASCRLEDFVDFNPKMVLVARTLNKPGLFKSIDIDIRAYLGDRYVSLAERDLEEIFDSVRVSMNKLTFEITEDLNSSSNNSVFPLYSVCVNQEELKQSKCNSTRADIFIAEKVLWSIYYEK